MTEEERGGPEAVAELIAEHTGDLFELADMRTSYQSS
jgi:hypothetical protein